MRRGVFSDERRLAVRFLTNDPVSFIPSQSTFPSASSNWGSNKPISCGVGLPSRKLCPCITSKKQRSRKRFDMDRSEKLHVTKDPITREPTVTSQAIRRCAHFFHFPRTFSSLRFTSHSIESIEYGTSTITYM